MAECFADPQVSTLGMTPEFEHPRLGKMRLLGQAINLTRSQPRVDRATPELGEHTNEILTELGFDREQQQELRAAKTI